MYKRQVLDKAADASWTRNDVLANNIAKDVYKRQDVNTFMDEIKKLLEKQQKN